MPHNHILLFDYYTQVTKNKDILEEFFCKILTKSKNSNNKTKKKKKRKAINNEERMDLSYYRLLFAYAII